MKWVSRVSGKHIVVCSKVLAFKGCFSLFIFILRSVFLAFSMVLIMWCEKTIFPKGKQTLLLVIVENFQHKNLNSVWFQICFFVFISFLKTNIHFAGLHLSTMYESVCNSHWSVWTLPEWAHWDGRKTGASWPPSCYCGSCLFCFNSFGNGLL